MNSTITNPLSLELCEDEELADIFSDHGLYSIVSSCRSKAIKVLLQFSISYLYALGFSYLNNIENKNG